MRWSLLIVSVGETTGLAAPLESGGSDGLEALYRRLRARYYEADAYDFRVPPLASVARQLFDMNEIEAAANVHELNIEYSDDAAAHGGLIQLRMVQALQSDGIEGMVARYHALKDEHPAPRLVIRVSSERG